MTNGFIDGARAFSSMYVSDRNIQMDCRQSACEHLAAIAEQEHDVRSQTFKSIDAAA